MARNGHRHILFVDDDADIREVVESRLELAGISVTTAEDGIDALHHLETGLFPDIIISDIQMPNMDGFAFFSTVRQNDEWLEIPFVGLTEDMDGTIARRARILGMTDFLRKPFDSDELLETIYSKTKDKSDGDADNGRVSTQPVTQALSRPESTRLEGRSDYSRFDNAPVVVDDSPSMSRQMVMATPKLPISTSAATSASAGAELKSYFRVLLWYKWVIIICTVVAVVLSFVASMLITPKYSASATLRVASASGGVVDYGSLALSSRLMNTYREIATSGPVIDELNERLGTEVAPAISVDSIVETELFTITATDADPEIAKDAANIMAEIMVERSLELYGGTTETYRQYLEDQLQEAEDNYQQAVRAYEIAIEGAQTDQEATNPEGGITQSASLVTAKLDILQKRVELFQQIYQDRLNRYENALVSEQLRANAISIVEPAYLPTAPSSPKKMFNAILGFGAGLVGGVGLAFLLETFKNAFRTIEDVQNVTSLPILAQVPNRSGGPLSLLRRRRRELFLTQKSKPSFFEPYHRLRVTLLGSRSISKGDVILLASAEPGAGKSTTTGNLGVAMAETGNRVILIDADFPRHGLTRMFNQVGKLGLGEVLLGQQSLAETIQDTQWPTLGFLPAGAVADEMTGRLSPETLEEVLAQLRQLYDYIVIDSPALLSIADATVIARQADAVVMVVSIRHSQPSELRMALQQLGDVNAKTVGLVINRAPKTRVYSYYARR